MALADYMEAGDSCPNCRRGNVTHSRPEKPFDFICPRCCTTYNSGTTMK